MFEVSAIGNSKIYKIGQNGFDQAFGRQEEGGEEICQTVLE